MDLDWISIYDINLDLQIPSPRQRINKPAGTKEKMPFSFLSFSTKELSIVCYVTPGNKPRPCVHKMLSCH